MYLAGSFVHAVIVPTLLTRTQSSANKFWLSAFATHCSTSSSTLAVYHLQTCLRNWIKWHEFRNKLTFNKFPTHVFWIWKPLDRSISLLPNCCLEMHPHEVVLEGITGGRKFLWHGYFWEKSESSLVKWFFCHIINFAHKCFGTLDLVCSKISFSNL